MSRSCAQRLVCTSLEGPPAPAFPPVRAAGAQPVSAKLSASSLVEANRPGSGVPGWPRLPGAVGLLCQNGRRVFPSSLCVAPTKGRVRVAASLCSAAWRPRRSLCQKGPAGSRRAPRAQTSHRFPGSSRAFLSRSPLSLPEHIQAASGPGCQGERRPCAGRARAGGGRQGSWHRKGKKTEKTFQPSLLVRKPEGMRNGPFWRSNHLRYDPSEGRTLQTNAICLPFKTQLQECYLIPTSGGPTRGGCWVNTSECTHVQMYTWAGVKLYC